MKKTFVIQVEYPDNDVIPSEEVMEVTQECIEHHMELHFGANIMDGDYDRIKVKEVTDGFSLVRGMREAQTEKEIVEMRLRFKIDQDEKISDEDNVEFATAMCNVVFYEDKVDEYLKKMEI